MTIHVDKGSLETTVSRRGFVKGAAGLTFAFALGPALLEGVKRLPRPAAVSMPMSLSRSTVRSPS